IQLSGNGLIGLGGVGELGVVLSGDSHVQSIVRTRGLIVVVNVIAQNVAGIVSGRNTSVDVHAVQGVADQTESQVSLNVSVLADGSAVAVCDGSNSVSVGVVAEGGNASFLRPGVEHSHAHAV